MKFQKPATVDQRRNFLSLYWLANPPPPAVSDHHLNAEGNRIAAPFLAQAIAAALHLPSPPPVVPAPGDPPPSR